MNPLPRNIPVSNLTLHAHMGVLYLLNIIFFQKARTGGLITSILDSYQWQTKWFSYLTFCHCFRAQLHSALIKGSEEERRLFRKIIPPCLRWPCHVITLDQWEESIQVAWSLSANQRQVSRSSYHSQPMRGLLTIAGWQRPNCIWVSRHRASGGGQLSGQSGSRISDELGRLPPYITQ